MNQPISEPLLEVVEIDVSYGPFKAIFGASFSLPRGASLALLGPNGAGKSTLARTVSGLIKPTRGKIIFDGQDITKLSPWEITRRSLIQVPEGRGIFATLGVRENLELAFGCGNSASQTKGLIEKVFETFPRLHERSGQLAGTLSGGEQRMLALARALVSPPKLLIVDELSLGLAPVVVDDVFASLEEIKKQGTSVLLIEQHVNRALEFSDHAVVMSKGEVVLEGPVSELGDMDTILIP